MRYPKLLALVALGVQPLVASAQTTVVPSTLTLDEAIALARRNNPAYLQTANNTRTADAAVRGAYGALLPNVSSSFSLTYAQSGQQYQNGAQLSASADSRSSTYGVGLNYTVNSGVLLNPRLQKSLRDATNADIASSAEALRAAVAQQYIAVLQAEARAEIQDTLVATASGQVDLAKAKTAAGTGTILDIRRAEVALGQAEVTALTARNNVNVEKMRLYQQLGVSPPASGDVKLTTQFPVARPTFTLDSVLGIARGQNPAVAALHSRERASDVAVKVRRGQYAPTLTLRTGIGGQSFSFADPNYLAASGEASTLSNLASCLRTDSVRVRLAQPLSSLNCQEKYVWTPEAAQAARSRNPNLWSYERAPMSFSAYLTLPLFDNFSREQAIEQSLADREDAMYAVRARELQLTTEVTQAYMNLVTAARTVEMQQVNAQRAREELTFAEERYRVGAVTFLDVSTARATFEQAQVDRINSIYSYHQAYAALEAAVGRPLR